MVRVGGKKERRRRGRKVRKGIRRDKSERFFVGEVGVAGGEEEEGRRGAAAEEDDISRE